VRDDAARGRKHTRETSRMRTFPAARTSDTELARAAVGTDPQSTGRKVCRCAPDPEACGRNALPSSALAMLARRRLPKGGVVDPCSRMEVEGRGPRSMKGAERVVMARDWNRAGSRRRKARAVAGALARGSGANRPPLAPNLFAGISAPSWIRYAHCRRPPVGVESKSTRTRVEPRAERGDRRHCPAA